MIPQSILFIWSGVGIANVSLTASMFMTNKLLWWTLDSVPLPLPIKPKILKEAKQWRSERRAQVESTFLESYFDNYFAEIASVHKYQTRLASLQNYYLTRMKTSLGQLALKYVGPKIWSDIPENLKLSSPYSFGKKYKKILLSCQTSCWSSFYMLVTFYNIALMPLFSLLSTSTVTHAFPHCFCCCFYAYFTWCWFDAFCYFYCYL